MGVVSGAGQFLLAAVIVVIKLIDTVSVTIHSLSHCVVWASLSKGGVLLVGDGRGARNLLVPLIIKTVDV